MRWKCLCSYKGTDFGGWQFQPTGNGVQNHLESALAQSLISRFEFMAAVELMRVFMLMDSVFILMAIGHTLRTN